MAVDIRCEINRRLTTNLTFYFRSSSSSKAHPFSAIYNNDGKSMIVYLRAKGLWTKDLIDSCGRMGPCGQPVVVNMWVQGPYSINFPDEAAAGADLILIGTGTGIAPLIGILMYTHTNTDTQTHTHKHTWVYTNKQV